MIYLKPKYRTTKKVYLPVSVSEKDLIRTVSSKTQKRTAQIIVKELSLCKLTIQNKIKKVKYTNLGIQFHKKKNHQKVKHFLLRNRKICFSFFTLHIWSFFRSCQRLSEALRK